MIAEVVSDETGGLTYSWQSSSNEINWTEIGSDETYTVGEDDDGLSIRVVISHTDGDGFGNENGLLESCETPTGYVPNGADCDDTDDLSLIHI